MSILSALGLSPKPRPQPAPAPASPMRRKSEPSIGGSRLSRPDGPRLSSAAAFTPTQPKPGRRQFAGRVSELERILQALSEERAHVVLYSERGRGKTSLCNLVVQSLRQDGIIVARHTCDTESTFDSIMRGLLCDLPAALLASPAADGQPGCLSALPPTDIRPQDVVAILPRLTCRALVCLIDEFDRVTDAATRTRLADSIKQLSDQGIALSFLVVGVSDDLDQILGQHPSIQRNLVAVHLPLMTDAEIETILVEGGTTIGLEFPKPALSRIVALTRGNPHVAQVLGLRLAHAAAHRAGDRVTDADIDLVIRQAIDEASPRDSRLYAALTRDGTDSEMATTLTRLAEAPEDRWGCLRAHQVAKGDVSIGTLAVTAETWAQLLSSGVLRPVNAAAGLVTFQNRSFLHLLLFIADHARRTTSPVEAPELRSLPAERLAAPSARIHRLSPR
jgi:hypothetical protein